MYIRDAILPRQEYFVTLCDKHNVQKLYAFGSSLTDAFDAAESDVDLMVEINERDPIKKGGLLLDFYTSMEGFFNRKVDMLTDQPLKNPYLRQEIENSKMLIYDGERKEVLI
ncbi:nucleotidyltransferase family protein [Olivibacter sitiensis]|uniref:nucleotidyltransferase family protein n=1 Tax=Olivibacter sitiensis TaxID=376470 RepID=UPI000407D9FB|nr:nucleotidyltransferase domain-containing protein [Olivibacter sitiensis]